MKRTPLLHYCGKHDDVTLRKGEDCPFCAKEDSKRQLNILPSILSIALISSCLASSLFLSFNALSSLPVGYISPLPPTPTTTFTPTASPTATFTPTATLTPTITSTPTATPTPANIVGKGKVSANNSSENDTSQNSARKAVDGNEQTWWSARDSDGFWEIIFERPYFITRIVLQIQQTPNGITNHYIYLLSGNEAPSPTTLAKVLSGRTQSGQRLDITSYDAVAFSSKPVTHIRIYTNNNGGSASWAAWREIQIEGIPAP